MARLFWLGLALLTAIHFIGWRRDCRLVKRHLEAETDVEAPEKLLRVSVLVAAWNEATTLPRLIESFQGLTYRDKELIICAGGDDGTFAIAKGLASASVRVIEQRPGDGQRGSQRKCLGVATGEVILLTDADCVLDDQSFLRTVAPICRGEDSVGGVYGPLSEQRQDPLVFYRWCADSFRQVSRPLYVEARDVNGANFAARREAFDASGGLQADAATGTDYDMATRLLQAGYRIKYAGHSVVQTRYESSVASYVWQNARWVRSAILYSRRFGHLQDLRQNLMGGLAGLAVLCLPLLRPIMGPAAVYLWLLIVAAYWGKRLRYLLLHSRLHGARLRPALFFQALAFSFLDFVAWALALIQALWPRWRGSW